MILDECLPGLGKALQQEIEESSSIKKFSADDFVVRQGELIRFLPIVVDGSVKVFSNENSMQFLLYYVTSTETCIFSFAHIFSEKPAEFSAVAEVDSDLVLLPIHKVREWLKKYPSFNAMILKGYQKHYDDLLHTTKQIICHNLEERLLEYLRTKAQIEGSNLLKITHQEIAYDLGTSREVITRLLKKLNAKNIVAQSGREIKVL